MKRTYTNPAYPIENNARTFSEPLILCESLNYKQLDETKTATDLLEIYFYCSKKKSKNTVNSIEKVEQKK